MFRKIDGNISVTEWDMETLEAEPTDIEPTEAIKHNNQYMPLLHNNQYAPLEENDEDVEDNKENTGVDIDHQKIT